MIDFSYHTSLKISAQNLENLVDFLDKIKFFSQALDIKEIDSVKKNFLYKFDFYNHNDSSSNIIAPCRLMLTSDVSCLLTFHPAAQPEIIE
jgi:hypothetical protein